MAGAPAIQVGAMVQNAVTGEIEQHDIGYWTLEETDEFVRQLIEAMHDAVREAVKRAN